MLKINLNQSNETQLTNLVKELSYSNDPLCPLIVIKISQAFCMYHQVSPHSYRIRNQTLQQNHPILINDLDNNFTYFMIDNNCGKIINLYLINDSRHLITIKSPFKEIRQPLKSNLDYFYYFTKRLEKNLYLKK